MSATEDLRRELAETFGSPIADMKAKLAARRDQLRAELTEVTEQLRMIERMDAILHPGTTATNGKQPTNGNKGFLAPETLVQRKTELVAYVEEHADEFPDGFHLMELHRRFKEAGKGWSTDALREVLDTLHRDGLIVLDGMMRGGGRRYKLVTTAVKS